MIEVKGTPGLQALTNVAALEDTAGAYDGIAALSYTLPAGPTQVESHVSTALVAAASDAGLVPAAYFDRSFSWGSWYSTFDTMHVMPWFDRARGTYLLVWNTTWNPTLGADDAVLKHYLIPVDGAALSASGTHFIGMPNLNFDDLRTAAASMLGTPVMLKMLLIGNTTGGSGGTEQDQFASGSPGSSPIAPMSAVMVDADNMLTIAWGSAAVYRRPLSAAAVALLEDPANSEYFSTPADQEVNSWNGLYGYAPTVYAVYDADLNRTQLELGVLITSYSNDNSSRKSFLVSVGEEADLELLP